jgi:thioredoxin 1
MKNSVIITILVVIIVLGGGIFFLSQQANNDSMVKQDKSMTDDKGAGDQFATPTYSEDSAMMDDKTASGRYVVYSQRELDKAKDKKRVLFFFANWCPTCKPADEDFTKNISKIPEDVVLIRVNYNDNETDQEEKALAQKYGVTYQHTYVQIDADGREVTKWNGGQTEELLTNIK